MKIHYLAIFCFVGISVTNQLVFAQSESDETTYLHHAKDVPNPGMVLDEDEVIQFQSDVTGDGQPEIFFSKTSFRDGKQGNIWSIYSRNPDGSISLSGEATFNQLAFAPKTWAKDTNQFGFYTYSPGGAGQGLLMFYGIINGHVKRLEQSKIEPNTTNKAEYDDIFRSIRKGNESTLSIKRTLVADVIRKSEGKSFKLVPDKFQAEETSTENTKLRAKTSTEEPTNTVGKQADRFKFWTLLVVIIALLLVVWLVLKGQLRRGNSK